MFYKLSYNKLYEHSGVTRNLQEDDEDWLVSHDNMSWRCEELKTEQLEGGGGGGGKRCG